MTKSFTTTVNFVANTNSGANVELNFTNFKASNITDILDACCLVAKENDGYRIVCPIEFTKDDAICTIYADDITEIKYHRNTDMLFIDQSYIDTCAMDEASEKAHDTATIKGAIMDKAKEQKDAILDMLDAWVGTTTSTINTHLKKNELLALIASNDDDVYANFRLYTLKVAMRMSHSKKTAKEATVLCDSLADAKDLVEDATTKGISLVNIKAFIAMCFRKAIAVLKGIAKFVISATLNTAFFIARGLYIAGKETVLVTSNIIPDFKQYIIASVK